MALYRHRDLLSAHSESWICFITGRLPGSPRAAYAGDIQVLLPVAGGLGAIQTAKDFLNDVVQRLLGFFGILNGMNAIVNGSNATLLGGMYKLPMDIDRKE